MKLFSWLYAKTISWSKHKHAPYYLAGVSFAESSFFPIPPDIMLISMGLAKPKSSLRLALITTVFSVLGGILGYLIGYLGIELVYQYLEQFHYIDRYKQVVTWFQQYGVWVVFLAGFAPIPYKFFTIAAGALRMPLLPFVLASLAGRGARFFLVSLLMFHYGESIQRKLHRYIDRIGWSLVIVFVIVFIIFKYL